MRGSCLCGDTVWEASGAGELVHHCHCSMCRKFHGTPFSTFGGFDEAGFRFVHSGSVRRYGGYAIQSAQPVTAGAAPLAGLTGINNALLIGKVESCSFVYNAGISPRNGLLTLTLKLTAGGESVTLMHQVQVDNSP